MEVHVFEFDYSKQKEFWFLLASDLHIGSRTFDYDRFKADFDEALERNARIYINGDVMRLIPSSDIKRYTKDEDRHPNKHGLINEEIELAEEILAPYANNIDVIGVGNHETAVYKRTNFEPMEELIFRLNTHRDTKKYGLIRHGGYTGFIRQAFRHGDNGAIRKFDIWYNHGQGKGGEVTGGIIGLERRKRDYMVNLIWLAHTHDYQFDGRGYMVKLDKSNRITWIPRRAIITGCYEKPIEQTNASSDKYKYNYGEATQRRLQSQGGVFMIHKLANTKLNTLYLLR